MNPTNQETRAYIVHLTDDARHSLSAYDFTFTPRDTFKTAQPLDTDALRLVLEAAKWALHNGKDNFIATHDAIAKLETLI